MSDNDDELFPIAVGTMLTITLLGVALMIATYVYPPPL